ncbi:MAG: VWA domain-containing protein [Chloracidobacterium sp.]|nr:VWA domain-containing protein [Chloracidobacterium sp.]MDW8216560.1 VWA domain-containing protein [Acidobacteriota bacterium]
MNWIRVFGRSTGRFPVIIFCAIFCALAVGSPAVAPLPTALAQSGATRKTSPPPNDKPNRTLPDEKPSTKPGDAPQGGQDPDRPMGTPRRRPPTKEPTTDDDGNVIVLTTNVVNLEVVVCDKKTGRIFTDLKPSNFTILEDGVKQDITNFQTGDSSITLVMVLEYSRVIGPLVFEVLEPAAQFIERFVRPNDYISIVPFDIRPKVLTDFTNDPAVLRSSIALLYRNFPAFTESNLFDALKFVIKGGKLDGEDYTGLEEVQGRTAILLIALGIDTFSRINYDQARKIVENAGVPIYCIGIGNLFYKLNDPLLSPEANLTFLQAFNTLRTFAESSGGRYFPVTFVGELPTTLRSIDALLRSQYSIGYEPTNPRREGKRRKIEVLVDIDGDGKPDNKRLELQYRRSYVEPGGGDGKRKK